MTPTLTDRPPVPITQLLPGDVVAMSHDGSPLTVLALSVPLAARDMLSLHTTAVPFALTMPPTTTCHLVSAPRVTMLPCLLCHGRYPYDYDLSDDGTPRAGICGPCNGRTDAAVALMRAESGHGADEPLGAETP